MIVFITGPNVAFNSMLASALRNNQINFGKGALVVDCDVHAGHDPKTMIEKIIKAEPFPKVVKETWLGDIPWKPESMVIFVNGGDKEFVPKFEALLPGFMDKMGPVVELKVG